MTCPPLWSSTSDNKFLNLEEVTSEHSNKPPPKKLSTAARYKALETFHNDIFTMIVKNFYTPEEFLALRLTSKTIKKKTEIAVKKIYKFHPAARTVYALMYLHRARFKRDVSLAKSYLEQAAEKGDPKACYWADRDFILNKYKYRPKTKEWYKKALKWYKDAADKKYTPACEVYGIFLLLGHGVDKNLKQAKNI